MATREKAEGLYQSTDLPRVPDNLLFACCGIGHGIGHGLACIFYGSLGKHEVYGILTLTQTPNVYNTEPHEFHTSLALRIRGK